LVCPHRFGATYRRCHRPFHRPRFSAARVTCAWESLHPAWGLGGGCLVLDHHCCESCLGVAPHRALHIHRVSIARVACHSAVSPHRQLSAEPMASTEHRAELRE
jgi:hypothetical protein